MNKKLIITSILLPLYSCGGSGGGSTSGTPADPETGVFLDSPVINIGYRTETLSGTTNSLGEYNFLRGETVTFFIGDLEFPATEATGVVTPLNIADTIDTTDPKVINMVRLLQTLDKDGDPDNGITITDTAKTNSSQVDFNLSVVDFDASTAVINSISDAGQDTATTSLIDENIAVAHFEGELQGDFSINLVGKTATSIVTTNKQGCDGVQAGFQYSSFTGTTMTRFGSDIFDNNGVTCSVTEDETQDITMTDLGSDYDIPFNCLSYPVCTYDDFNKTLEYSESEGGTMYTSIYTFNPITNVMIYSSSTDSGRSSTEIITITE